MATVDGLFTTPLYQLHMDLGAKMVPFAGYSMPVQYPMGILKEHLHTRSAVGLFDVSHMGQVLISGSNALAALEQLVPADLLSLPLNQQKYSLLTNEAGGIRDDLMILNRGDYLHVVVNAACKLADVDYIKRSLPADFSVQLLDDRALLALQGPKAVEVLKTLMPGCEKLRFMEAGDFEFDGFSCLVTRSGYTGEDGYEISVKNEAAQVLARTLLSYEEVEPVGLGARDSLRLEAGLCLYGHDIDESTTPIEAALAWVISPARRKEGEREGGFPGAEIILKQMQTGVSCKRVGLKPLGRAPVRDGAELCNKVGECIGSVCSGGFGPSVGAPVAMAYVLAEHAVVGQELQAVVRGKNMPVEVCRLPFVKQRYYRGDQED